MAEPYLSEIRMMAFDFAPPGWALCDGALLSVQDNQALFELLGTTFGGNGTGNFALPDLRGRAPMHVGGAHVLGEQGGTQAHSLSAAEIPAHTHVLYGTNANGTTSNPANAVLGAFGSGYGTSPQRTTLNPGTVALAGSGQGHPNMQPFLALSFCIYLQGSPPSPAST